MLKTITTAAITAGLILGGAGIASADTGSSGTGSAVMGDDWVASILELAAEPEVVTGSAAIALALVPLLLESGSGTVGPAADLP